MIHFLLAVLRNRQKKATIIELLIGRQPSNMEGQATIPHVRSWLLIYAIQVHAPF